MCCFAARIKVRRVYRNKVQSFVIVLGKISAAAVPEVLSTVVEHKNAATSVFLLILNK